MAPRRSTGSSLVSNFSRNTAGQFTSTRMELRAIKINKNAVKPRKKGRRKSDQKSRSSRRRKVLKVSSETDCLFCCTNENSEFGAGKLLSCDGIFAHYYCMLFSSGLLQRGKKDSDGLLGFLPEDIRKEVARGKRLRCCHCKKTGATVGCMEKTCRKAFHYPCSIECKNLSQFFGAFPTYCQSHIPVLKINRILKPGVNSLCCICLAAVEIEDEVNTVIPPCCRNGTFHKQCIQIQAIVSGYFFKCPLCNNKDDFQKDVLEHGIYIPEQDAAWELEQGAFQELYVRYSRCDQPVCMCPDGRKYDVDDTKWEVLLCSDCGSQGCHVECGNLVGKISKIVWRCHGCLQVAEKLNGLKKDSPKQLRSGTTLKESVSRERRSSLREASADDHSPIPQTSRSNPSSPSTSKAFLKSPICNMMQADNARCKTISSTISRPSTASDDSLMINQKVNNVNIADTNKIQSNLESCEMRFKKNATVSRNTDSKYAKLNQYQNANFTPETVVGVKHSSPECSSPFLKSLRDSNYLKSGNMQTLNSVSVKVKSNKELQASSPVVCNNEDSVSLTSFCSSGGTSTKTNISLQRLQQGNLPSGNFCIVSESSDEESVTVLSRPFSEVEILPKAEKEMPCLIPFGNMNKRKSKHKKKDKSKKKKKKRHSSRSKHFTETLSSKDIVLRKLHCKKESKCKVIGTKDMQETSAIEDVKYSVPMSKCKESVNSEYEILSEKLIPISSTNSSKVKELKRKYATNGGLKSDEFSDCKVISDVSSDEACNIIEAPKKKKKKKAKPKLTLLNFFSKSEESEKDISSSCRNKKSLKRRHTEKRKPLSSTNINFNGSTNLLKYFTVTKGNSGLPRLKLEDV